MTQELNLGMVTGGASGGVPLQLHSVSNLWIIFTSLQIHTLLQVLVMVRIVVLQFSYNRETVQMQLMYFKCSRCVFYQTPTETVAGVAGGVDRK